MDENGNRSSVPEDSMGDDAFSRLLAGGVNARQIHELVQKLRELKRDNSDDYNAVCYDYLRKWLAENSELDGVDSHYAFIYGFVLGIAFFRELYTSSDRTQKKEEGEE